MPTQAYPIKCSTISSTQARNLSANHGRAITVNGTLMINRLGRSDGSTSIYHSVRLQNDKLVSDRDWREIISSGPRYQFLHCNVESSRGAIPRAARFSMSDSNVSAVAGIIAVDHKCLTVKDSAVSIEKCATTTDDLAPPWMHLIECQVVHTGHSNGTAAEISVEGDEVTRISPPVHERKYCGLMLYKMPVDFREDKNDNSQTGNTHRSVSRSQFVYVFCAVSFLQFLG